MTPTIRLLPFAEADGATNMAADEALLESAANGEASLRFYAWNEPTLSLGYFQPGAVRTALQLESLAWVRRATGGGAIVHHRELTYALALPSGNPWHGPEPWSCRFHHLVQGVLAGRGLNSHAVSCGDEKALGPGLCFLDQTAGDLLVGDSKVVGSAQRKMRGALLQHGSLLLRTSEFAPMLRGISDAGVPLAPESLAEALASRFASETGWHVRPGDWAAAERNRIPVIRAEKYANPDWNAKR